MFVYVTANLTNVIRSKNCWPGRELHVSEGQFRAALSLAATDQMIAFALHDGN